MNDSIPLTALDAANPLGFLAAVGVLRLLAGNPDTQAARLRWAMAGTWQPEIVGLKCKPKELPAALLHCPGVPLESVALLGKNIKVPQSTFHNVAIAAQGAARRGNRAAADLVAAFGSEAFLDREERIQYTDLCFITGSGHQDFLSTAEKLNEKVTPEHLESAVFGPWQLDMGLSLRWDPSDASEYALQWRDPSKEGKSAVWGANWLAFQSLPCFPTQPGPPAGAARVVRTTGFFRARRQDPEFRWPVWTTPLSLPSVCSLLAHAEIHKPEPDHQALRAMGILQVFHAQRVHIPPRGSKFKVNFRPATAL